MVSRVSSLVRGRPPAEVFEQPLPSSLGIADDHGIRVLERLIGKEGRVIAAHDHRHASAAVRIRDRIGAARGECLDAQGDEIGLFIERHRLGFFVVEAHLPSAGARGQDAHGQRRHGIGGAVIAEIRPDESEPHSSAASGCAGRPFGGTLPSKLTA